MAADATGSKRHVLVIGGGLGGLCLAQGLHRAGVQVTVFERDVHPTGREQGYHIGVNDEGAAALRRMAGSAELDEALRSEGSAIEGFAIRTPDLTQLVDIPGSTTGGIVDRCHLREVLTHGLEDCIQWDKRFTRYEELPDGRIRVFFEDDTSADGDFVVGADGIHSGVRAQRAPRLQLRSVHLTNILGEASPEVAPRLREAMARHMVRIVTRDSGCTWLLFAFKRVNGVEGMWWAMTHPTPEALPEGVEALREYVLSKMGPGFHPELRRMVQETPNLAVSRELHDITPTPDNPLAPATRVTLLGDAAHAMTTHRGLGANTAFMDAAELCDALQAPDWHAALTAYNQTMINRGFKHIKESRQSSQMITMRGFGAGVRNTFMRVMAAGLWVYQRCRRQP